MPSRGSFNKTSSFFMTRNRSRGLSRITEVPEGVAEVRIVELGGQVHPGEEVGVMALALTLSNVKGTISKMTEGTNRSVFDDRLVLPSKYIVSTILYN
jgi:hypothetical protein